MRQQVGSCPGGRLGVMQRTVLASQNVQLLQQLPLHLLLPPAVARQPLITRLLTKSDTFIEKDLMMNMVMTINDWNGKMPLPAILKPRPMWTGKQVGGLGCEGPATHNSTDVNPTPPLVFCQMALPGHQHVPA